MVPFQADPTEVIGRRIAAYAIDLAIAYVVVGIVVAASWSDLHRFLVPTSSTDEVVSFAPMFRVWLRLMAAQTVVTVGNRWVLQGLTGASLGKHALDLRVVAEDGSTVRFWPNALRELVLIADSAFSGIVGLVAACTSQGHRRLGDMVAKTYVVRTADAGDPIVVPAPQPAPWASPPMAFDPDGPRWDAARACFIRYDRPNGRWIRWSDALQQWGPLDP